jgi:hypothetical protein
LSKPCSWNSSDQRFVSRRHPPRAHSAQ